MTRLYHILLNQIISKSNLSSETDASIGLITVSSVVVAVINHRQYTQKFTFRHFYWPNGLSLSVQTQRVT